MSLIPKDTYPGQIDTSDPTGYPHGKARNITTPGDGTGTPWEEQLVNDVFGMQQALLDQAGITPSGTPDKVGASQYLTAVETIGDQRIAAEFYAAGAERIVSDEWRYPSPKTRVRRIPAITLVGLTHSLGTVDPPWALDGLDSGEGAVLDGTLRSNTHRARLIVPLEILVPPGATVTRIKAIVQPGAGRSAMSADAGDNGRMFAATFQQVMSFGSPPSFSSSRDSFSDDEQDGTTDPQVLDSGTVAYGIVKGGTSYVYAITAGSDSGTNRDTVAAVEITYTDYGPRNP